LEKTKAPFDILLRFIGGQKFGHGQRIAVVIGRQDEHPGLVAGLFNASQAREGANKSYGTRAFTGNPLILND
ncbi:hypothetical protein ACB283_21505, partial [Aeromonas caviae]